MKIKRKTYFVMAIVIITCISLAIAAREIKNSRNNPKNEDLYGKITVWSEEDNLSSLKLTGERFKKLHPKVKIEYENVDKDNLYAKLISGFASSSGLPDLFSVKDDYIYMFVDKFADGFLDISSTVSPIKSKFINSKMLQGSVKGKNFAIPFNTEPTAVFYRKDIFKKANIFPEDIKTWEDYIKAGKTILLSSVGTTKMLPLEQKNQDVLFREMLNQLNTGYFDKDGKIVLNTEKSIRAMEIIKKLNEDGLFHKVDGIVPLNAAIKNGTVATLPFGSSFSKQLTVSVPEQAKKWGVMKLPAFEPGGNNIATVEGSSIMITKASKNTKVSLEFAEFAMTDTESLSEGFNKYGILPAYMPFYDTENLDKGVIFFQNQKIWTLFSSIAKDSIATNFTERITETKSKVIKAQTDILNNHLDVKTTMDALQADLNKTPAVK